MRNLNIIKSLFFVTACVTPGELGNGTFKEILKERYAENETVSFVCSEFYLAEPRDPKSSDVLDGLLTCGRDGWLAPPTCIRGNINTCQHVVCKTVN